MTVDYIIKNVSVYNSYFKRFAIRDVAVKNGLFFYIGDASRHPLKGKEIDGTGLYMVPGLIDCHMHIESSMTTPYAFSAAVWKYGVTTVVAEPHEIANVFGLEGIEAWLSDAEGCDLDVRLAIPSSVPSTNERLETTGGTIEVEDVRRLLANKRTVCLGEIMNCRDLLTEEPTKTGDFISLCKEHTPLLPVEGHCPAFMDRELATIIYRGVTADHTEQTPERIEARIGNGMFVQLQNKTLRKENIDYIKEHQLLEHIAIVTDDTMPHDLAEKGHLDVLVRKAMQLGLTPEEAVYVTTFTPARRMNLIHKGAIAPGKEADFLLLSDIYHFRIEATYIKGREVYNRQKETESIAENAAKFPAHFMHSVHVPEQRVDDFSIRTQEKEGVALCKIMIINDGTTFIEQGEAEIPVKDYKLQWESSPYALATVIERHGKNGNRGYALVGGGVMKKGAVATTYAHDHHNLLVVGQTKESMVTAANKVIEAQGGYAVAEGKTVTAFAPLPVAGILYDGPVSQLGRCIRNVDEEMARLGYEHSNRIMSLSTLGLPVSPYIKVTDKGLIDVRRQTVIPLYEMKK